MEVKLEKIVNYRKPYEGKDGKSRPSTTLYLVIEIGNGEQRRVAIKNAFDRASDRVLLDMAAKAVIIREDGGSTDENPQPKPDHK